MSTLTAPIQIWGLERGQLSALRKKARRLKTTPEAYVRKLIAEDLELDRLVTTKSLSELSAPIRGAFKDTSEEEIGKLVEDARRRQHRRLAKR